ncbi:MAG: heme A synthase [Salinibacterium sp.]|nr:MAG: heme A synthase [Salinibacterium sp.]
MKGLFAPLPTAIDARIRFFAVASLVANILIVGSGGAVRLTGSGLGCPTWPRCTDDSLVATPEMGIHGAIEFGNRMLSFVLVLIAIVMFVLIWRMRTERKDLFRLALLLGLGIPAQALLGGITVLTHLNPIVVGLHFVLSVVLVALATVLVYRVYLGQRGPRSDAPGWLKGVTHLDSLLLAITIGVGILTTGAGPHAGDSAAARNGLDLEWLEHVHSWPAYATFAVTIALVVGAILRKEPRLRRFAILLLVIEGVQIAVGITQARLGLPPLLIDIHMVLACCLVSAMTAVVLSLRERQPA